MEGHYPAAPGVPAQGPGTVPPAGRLALIFQEMFTVIVRLRANRQAVNNAESFRTNMRSALKQAGAEAASQGYSADYSKFASFAVIAFLDESILNSGNPVFADWPRRPLGEELFGSHLAGEIFFQGLERLLTAKDSRELGDLLEVYYLCLLLGYRGRYGVSGPESTHALMEAVGDKIRRIRGPLQPLSPAGGPLADAPPQRPDPWMRRLVLLGIALAVLTAALLVGFGFSLRSGFENISTAMIKK
jgi:type VI secretion system protein ImpK